MTRGGETRKFEGESVFLTDLTVWADATIEIPTTERSINGFG